MRKAILFILFSSFVLALKSQNLNNYHTKTFEFLTDSIFLDNLSIVPNSEIIFSENNLIVPDTLYSIDYAKSLLLISNLVLKKEKQLTISYRTFPINFSEKYAHRKLDKTIIVGPILAYPQNDQMVQSSFFNDTQLDKRGSIARGITVGNNQDAVINSNLNLQISGKLNNDMQILAAISDNNIPIQPDGNSQQIQDFDKVFIQLYNEKTKLIAGDFEIDKPQGYFMNVNKKAQGGLLNTRVNSKKQNKTSFETTISGAVTKGKYCRKTFQGQEGNQGPYKLTGCENEQYIIILAGTEKVYIDGKLQNRGKEYDYIIDYNTGEVSFTANRLITKDSRIAIEFEYSEKSYARFMIYNTNELNTKNGKYWINIYTEQDSKNQPINQDLTDEQKQLLSESGDQIENAYVPNVDSVEFRNDYVLYLKKDTITNGNTFEIYEYSTNPKRAVYQIGFNYVGPNKGNYTQIQSAANGKVFEWLAPIAGIPQGSYEPVRLLIAPKKQQMVSLGGDININKSTSTNFEFALSNYDVNTFSSKDASDNVGYALKIDLEKDLTQRDTLKNSLKTILKYQLINKNFTAIERFRSIEFERDWNIVNPFTEDEHYAQIGLKYRHKKTFAGLYNFNLLTSDSDYKGYRNELSGSYNKSGYSVLLNSSLLNSESDLNTTQFIRYLARISKSVRLLTIGVENEMEQNIWNSNITDSLLQNSFQFSSYKIFIENPDSSINDYNLSYTLRNDYLPLNNNLKQSTQADNFQIGFGLLKNPSSILKTSINYRTLKVTDTSFIQSKEENTITGQLDYSFRLFKGAISSSIFYEAGSGLEPKREYSFLQVTSGQGVYTWEDYNQNGVAELDEFEIAQFQDQANYIRIFSPGNDYIKTYKNEYSQIFNLRPEMIWNSKSGVRKIISRFSNNLAFSVNQKSTDEMLEHSLNPFFNSNDSTTINLNRNIRNTFSFNQSNSRFGIDYIYQQANNKVLLSNGFDDRIRSQNGLKIRWNFISDFTLQNYVERGNKKYQSQYFSTKNYSIDNLTNEFKLQYLPGFQTKLEISYKYMDKKNRLLTEKSTSHDIGLEINYSVAKKGNLLAKGNYLKIKYNSDPNTSIAYEMLQALKPGNNATWSLMFQRKIAGNLEMNIVYNGRASENIKIIHTGSIQLRAFF